MAQTTQLIDTLQRSPKVHGKTYADTARHLNLSAASVKRLFSERSLSFQRLDQVCPMMEMEMEISDLVRMMIELTLYFFKIQVRISPRTPWA